VDIARSLMKKRRFSVFRASPSIIQQVTKGTMI
jgi:hypothetical protein